MCLAFYIASKFPLPVIDWDQNAPAFYSRALDTYERGIKKQFRWTHIRYLGSSQGCGCGFILDGADVDELPLVRADRARLVSYVRDALITDPELELFGCWEGDQEMTPTKVLDLSLDELATFEFAMNERILVEKVKL